MNQIDEMEMEAFQKVEAGFNCIKFKIGALDFDAECRLLERIRKRYNAFKLEIRVDANGAFGNFDVFEKLKELKRFDLHSIEQPIKTRQPEMMQEVCAKSPINIALDEELIGVHEKVNKQELLKYLHPQFIILKPSLHGGIKGVREWIEIAENNEIQWWMTSALESNIGLSAICQFTAEYANELPQGLGTGSLYSNNFDKGLIVDRGYISFLS
jgi:L-alanine-DL-glutamate epimerase-like enolase superfamily enzyme